MIMRIKIQILDQSLFSGFKSQERVFMEQSVRSLKLRLQTLTEDQESQVKDWNKDSKYLKTIKKKI